jgi:hypothetical protein
MKLSLYFLFYVAMILELLIFIVDRDTAEESLATATEDMIAQMSSIDTVKIFGTPGFKLGGNDSTTLSFYTFKLISDAERTTVRYQVRRTYRDGGMLLKERVDTSFADGSVLTAVDSISARGRDGEKNMYLRCSLWRDGATGDLSVKVVHDLPMRVQGGRTFVSPNAFYFGAMEVEVSPILKRAFPESIRRNQRIVDFLKNKLKISVDNFYPPSQPAVTMIEFKPTENVKVGIL